MMYDLGDTRLATLLYISRNSYTRNWHALLNRYFWLIIFNCPRISFDVLFEVCKSRIAVLARTFSWITHHMWTCIIVFMTMCRRITPQARTYKRKHKEYTVREKRLKYKYLLHLFLRSVLHNVVFVGGAFLQFKSAIWSSLYSTVISFCAAGSKCIMHVSYNSIINY